MTMTKRFTTSAIDKLGRRLARSEHLDAVDLDQLLDLQGQWRGSLDPVLQIVASTLRLAPHWQGLGVTHRVKTIETLIEKLRTRNTRLSTMQDVVGIRIVGCVGLRSQDRLAGVLAQQFEVVRVDDRRAKPSHGYRAVHVIPTVDGFPVEIQVRTAAQHAWANMTEAIADRWGRQIRYGQAPTGSDEAQVAERARVLSQWQLVSDRLFDLDVRLPAAAEEARSPDEGAEWALEEAKVAQAEVRDAIRLVAPAIGATLADALDAMVIEP
jgi:hypothetical protein